MCKNNESGINRTKDMVTQFQPLQSFIWIVDTQNSKSLKELQLLYWASLFILAGMIGIHFWVDSDLENSVSYSSLKLQPRQGTNIRSPIHLKGLVAVLGPGENRGKQDKKDECSCFLVAKRQIQMQILNKITP